MSHNTELEAEWVDREIAKLKQLIAKEENEMRDDARLSQVSNSVSKKKTCPHNSLLWIYIDYLLDWQNAITKKFPDLNFTTATAPSTYTSSIRNIKITTANSQIKLISNARHSWTMGESRNVQQIQL